jgi:hypothetical protein
LVSVAYLLALISIGTLKRKEPQKRSQKDSQSKPRETLTLTLDHEQKRGGGQRTTYLVRLAPPTVGVHGTPTRRPDPARPWASRGQRPGKPPQGRSPGLGSRHHGEAARRRRAHLAVDASADEGARRGAARPAVALARSLGLGKTMAPWEKERK